MTYTNHSHTALVDTYQENLMMVYAIIEEKVIENADGNSLVYEYLGVRICCPSKKRGAIRLADKMDKHLRILVQR